MNAVIQSNVPVMTKSLGLVERFGMKYGVEGAKVLETLKTTCFKGRNGSAPSNAEMMALLIVSEQYGLNPFTKEIYAFQAKGGGIVPVVGVDGWNRISNDHAQYDGVEFRYSEKIVHMDDYSKPCPEWCEAWIFRKDRTRPIVAREYLDEVYVKPSTRDDGKPNIGPWQSHTKRFLRHKALIQCARIAFGFSGIYDEDDALNIAGGPVIEHEHLAIEPEQKTGATSKLDAFAGTATAVQTNVDPQPEKAAEKPKTRKKTELAEAKPEPKDEPTQTAEPEPEKGADPTSLFGADT